MGAIVTNVLYVSISLALVGVVGRTLSRSGRAFLGEMFGGRADVAEAVNRLLVVAFYLLSLGFITLTMQVWSHVSSFSQALQLLLGKIGELLLVLGVLHVASTVVFARLRRARSWPAKYGPGGFGPGAGGPAGSGRAGSGSADFGTDASGTDASGTGSPGTGRPVARPAGGPADDTPAAGAGAREVPPALWRPRPGHALH